MSNIQELIETVQADGVSTREVIAAGQTQQDFMLVVLEQVRDSIVSLGDSFSQYFADEQARFNQAQQDLKAARRAELERLKESQGMGFVTPVADSSKPQDKKPKDGDEGDGLDLGDLGIGSIVLGATAAFSGYIYGLLADVGRAFKSLGTTLTKTIPENIMNSVRGFTSSISTQFDDVIASIKNNKVFASISQSYTNLVNNIKSFFAPLVNLRETFSIQEGGKIDKLFNLSSKSADNIGKSLEKIFKGFVRLSRPIALIIAAFNTIVKSFEIFGDDSMSLMDKLGNVLNTVLTELTSALVTMPIEIVKDIVSWIAGALGFENVEKFLDSFDIDAMFREGMGVIGEMVDRIINFIADGIYEAATRFLPDFITGGKDLDRETRIAERELNDAASELLNLENMGLKDTTMYVEARQRYEEALEEFEGLERAQQQRAADQQAVQLAATLDEETQKTSLDAAKESGLYDKDGFVFGDSEIDKDVLAKTTDQNQLKAILNDNDLDEEDRKLVIQRLNELNGPNRQLPTTTSQEYAEAPPPPPPAKTDYSDVASYSIDQDDQVLKNRTPLRQQLQQALDSGTDFDPEQMLAIELGKMQGVDFPSEVQSQYNQQLKTVSGQDEGETYTGVQAAKRTAEEQGLEAYRIEPVTEDDGFGEQVETGEYKVIPRQAEATSVTSTANLSGIDFSQASSSQEVRRLVKDAGGDRSMQNSARMMYDAGIDSQLIQTAVGTGVEVSKSTLGRPETISQLIQSGMERSEVYRLARDMGVQDPNAVVDMGVNMARTAVPQPTATQADQVQSQPTATPQEPRPTPQEPRVVPITSVSDMTSTEAAERVLEPVATPILSPVGNAETQAVDQELRAKLLVREEAADALKAFEAGDRGSFKMEEDEFGFEQKVYDNAEEQAQYKALLVNKARAGNEYYDAKQLDDTLDKVEFLQDRGLLPQNFSGNFSGMQLDKQIDDYLMNTVQSNEPDTLSNNILGSDSVIRSAVEPVEGTASGDTMNSYAERLYSSVLPTGGLGTAPVAQASKSVDIAKSQPQVVALGGGSNQSITNNYNQSQIQNYGAMSARSQDVSLQRQKDQMSG